MKQIRIAVTSELSAELLSSCSYSAAKAISKIATDNAMEPIFTYDAIKAYCDEIE